MHLGTRDVRVHTSLAFGALVPALRLHQAPWDQMDGVYIEIGVLGRRIECQIVSSDFQFGNGICNAIS